MATTGVTGFTRAANDFKKISDMMHHRSEVSLAQQNCVASFKDFEIKEGDRVIWSQNDRSFLEKDCPDSAHPNLWYNAQACHETGLFKVTDTIYQLRGFDMANLTLILTPNKHWIVYDVLMSMELARASIEFADKWFVENGLPTVDGNLAAIIISHPHVDHFGGIRGVFPELEVNTNIPIYAPKGFTQASITENLMAQTAMSRRAGYQYGTYLEKSETGLLSIGIGQGESLGTVSFAIPAEEIQEDKTLVIDDLVLEVQLTEGTEAPAELNTYFPQYKALWMAENCTSTMHNLYTLRGAEIRDSQSWSKDILKARHLFGDKAEVMFHAHTWPRYITDSDTNVIKDYLDDQARMYKGIHDQTLKAINSGFTMKEVEYQVNLPEELMTKPYLRPHYGTLSHNAKAVYQKYMGWYDSNPANLHSLPPEAESKKIIEYMGGAESALKQAKADFEAGNYEWVAQVTNWLVFADPDNKSARELGSQTFTQLGYQSESGTWRNEYLSGAKELLHGPTKDENLYPMSTADLMINLSGQMILDLLAIETVNTDTHLSGSVRFSDDWEMQNGKRVETETYFNIDFWKGIFTYYPITTDEFNKSEKQVYSGPRMDFFKNIVEKTNNSTLAEWTKLFDVSKSNRFFNIIEP